MVGFWAGEEVSTPNGPEMPSPTNYYEPVDTSAFTDEVWDVLEDERVPIYLHVRYGRDFGPVPGRRGVETDAVALVREANRRDVPVIAWLVVPMEDGYWAYEGNAGLMHDVVRAWARWKRSHRLHFDSAALDQEFSHQTLQRYIETIGRPDQLASFMRDNIDPAEQCRAMRTYRDVIAWGHRRGIPIQAAVAPPALDDLLNGDLALQDAYDIAAIPPSSYDRMYLMAYRGSVASAAGFDPGSGYVASYFQDMQRYFPGTRGQVSIGLGGQAPYDNLDTLVNDVRMLAGLGATTIPVYSLETTVERLGASGVRSIVQAGRNPLAGPELAAAATPSQYVRGIRASVAERDATAGALTRTVTAEHGDPRPPNSYPNGCGDLSTQPPRQGR